MSDLIQTDAYGRVTPEDFELFRTAGLTPAEYDELWQFFLDTDLLREHVRRNLQAAKHGDCYRMPYPFPTKVDLARKAAHEVEQRSAEQRHVAALPVGTIVRIAIPAPGCEGGRFAVVGFATPLWSDGTEAGDPKVLLRNQAHRTADGEVETFVTSASAVVPA